MALPRFVVLKSNQNNKYLRYTHIKDHEDLPAAGLLEFTGDEVGSHYAKFEVETAKSTTTSGDDKELVHVRCCYNNKYWVSQLATNKFGHDECLIVAAADEPEEDQSKRSCTLFEPIFLDLADDNYDHDDDGDDHAARKYPNVSRKSIQFCHVRLGLFATQHNSGALVVEFQSNAAAAGDAFTFVDWETLVILPKYVAFRGENEPYLCAQWIDNDPYLQFKSSEIGDPMVGNEVSTMRDGTIRIKSNYFGKFWRRTLDDWIWPDADENTSNTNSKDTLFWPIKIDDHFIALRNLGNNYFCKRYTVPDIESGFSANVPNIQVYARLQVEELVMSRKIYNVDYHLMHSRIYNCSNDIEIAQGEAVNLTQDIRTIGLKLLYKKSKTSVWNNASSVTLKLGLKNRVEAGGVPVIGDDGKIQINSSDPFRGEVKFGEAEKLEIVVESACEVCVPAMSTMKLRLMATKASCDVPFSYSRRDMCTNGTVQVVHDMDDGVYTGINFFNFKYETNEQKL